MTYNDNKIALLLALVCNFSMFTLNITTKQSMGKHLNFKSESTRTKCVFTVGNDGCTSLCNKAIWFLKVWKTVWPLAEISRDGKHVASTSWVFHSCQTNCHRTSNFPSLKLWLCFSAISKNLTAILSNTVSKQQTLNCLKWFLIYSKYEPHIWFHHITLYHCADKVM